MQSIAIVPAAGESRRMGRPKLLLPWRGKTVIEQVLGAWRRSQVSHVVLVARAEDWPLLEIARRMGAASVAANPPPEEMKDSVARGLAFAERAYAPQPEDVWLLAPADMPRLAPEVIDRLLAKHNPEKSRILVPRVGERNGHPVLFPWPLAEEVSQLGRDEGVNALTERFAYRTVPFDDASLFADLDTPEDYRRLQEQM